MFCFVQQNSFESTKSMKYVSEDKNIDLSSQHVTRVTCILMICYDCRIAFLLLKIGSVSFLSTVQVLLFLSVCDDDINNFIALIGWLGHWKYPFFELKKCDVTYTLLLNSLFRFYIHCSFFFYLYIHFPNGWFHLYINSHICHKD